MAKVWNADLAHAAEVRVWYHMSKGSSKEFMWRKAHEAILAVEKEIRQYSSGRVVNMPKIKERTTLVELEAVIRGEPWNVGYVAGLHDLVEHIVRISPVANQLDKGRPVGPETRLGKDYAQHPYLKRMQFRGGGYAILMAFHLRASNASRRQFMYKSELLHEAEPFCDVTMEGGWGTANGWTSIRLSHRLVLSSRGPQGGHEEYRLSPEGWGTCQVLGGDAPALALGWSARRWWRLNPQSSAPLAGKASVRASSLRPRWRAQTFGDVGAAPTPFSAAKRRRSSPREDAKEETEEIEISSDSHSVE
eukprot:Skav231437  [mRNA]  locus=scaffold1847:170670:177765:+ [translate_table: standard]